MSDSYDDMEYAAAFMDDELYPPSPDIMTNKEARKLGQEIVDLLKLKQNIDKRYDTTWGDKTLTGLGLTIKRITEETLCTEQQ